MKKSLITLLSLLPMLGFAADGDRLTAVSTEGITINFTVVSEADKTCEVGFDAMNTPTISREATGTLTIPSTVDGYTVIGLQAYAFYDEMHITKFILPNTVTYIEQYAFDYNGTVEEVVLSDHLKDIGQRCFRYCGQLKEITLPASCDNIGNYAFNNCKSLSKVTCLATVPPGISEGVFKTIASAKVLYVPHGTKDAYAEAVGWKDFPTIIELDAEPIKIAINAENFPDEYFRMYLQSLPIGEDNILTEDELATTATLDLTNKRIEDLTGIGYFTALTTLNLTGNRLYTVDLSKNKALTELRLTGNNLTQLDLTKNTALKKVYINKNADLSSVDLTGLTAMTYLEASETGIMGLELSTCSSLSELLVSKCPALTVLDISSAPKMNNLKAFNCPELTTIIGNEKLTEVNCYNSPLLTTLDLSACNGMTTINAYSCALTTVDISNMPNLKRLDVNDNKIAALDLSNAAKMTSLLVRNNPLTALDCSGATALATLLASGTQLVTIHNLPTSLKTLDAKKSAIQHLDVSQLTELTSIDLSENQIEAFDLSKNEKLAEAVFDGQEVEREVSVVDDKVVIAIDNAVKASMITDLKVRGTAADSPVIEAIDGQNYLILSTEAFNAAEWNGTTVTYSYRLGIPVEALAGTTMDVTIQLKAEVVTGIQPPTGSPEGESSAAWYTLDGRKFNTQPTQRGVYIHNGKVMVVK